MREDELADRFREWLRRRYPERYPTPQPRKSLQIEITFVLRRSGAIRQNLSMSRSRAACRGNLVAEAGDLVRRRCNFGFDANFLSARPVAAAERRHAGLSPG
jgi:hypothetical protein